MHTRGTWVDSKAVSDIIAYTMQFLGDLRLIWSFSSIGNQVLRVHTRHNCIQKHGQSYCGGLQ